MKTITIDQSFEFVKYSPVCLFCEHLIDAQNRQCRAFDSIPIEIWNGNNDHKKPYPNDRGYQFSKK